MLTAKADIESKLEGLSTGADAYLEKPFNNLKKLFDYVKPKRKKDIPPKAA